MPKLQSLKAYLTQWLKLALIIVLPFLIFAWIALQIAGHEHRLAISRLTERLVKDRTGQLKNNLHDLLGEAVLVADFVANQPTPVDQLSKPDTPFRSLMRSLIEHHPNMLQLRVLDAKGKEVIRYDRDEQGVSETPDHLLQDKAHRDYFIQAGKSKNMAMISAFTLNREHGRIELPFMPSIRLIVPIRKNNQCIAMVIINANGQKLIRDLTAPIDHGIGQIWMVNHRGQWMIAPERAWDWQHETTSRPNTRRLTDPYPKLWQQIKQNHEGRLITSQGLFAYRHLDNLEDRHADDPAGQIDHAESWVIIGHVPPEDLQPTWWTIAWILLIIATAVLCISSLSLAISRVQRAAVSSALAKSEQRLHTIADSINDALLLLDDQWRIRFWSSAAENLFGPTSQQVMGRPFDATFIHEKDYPDVRHFLQETLPSTQTPIICFEAIGQHRHFEAEMSVRPLQESDSRMWVASIRDISHRIEQNKKITQLSMAVQQSADIIFITDPQGMIEYVNPAFEAITGYAAEQAIGSNPRILQSGKMDIDYYRHVWQTITQGQPISAEVINRRKNGKLFYYDQTITPMTDEQGNIIHFLSTGKDITDRKHAEQQLALAKFAMDHAIVPIFLVRRNSRIAYVNQQASQMLGYSIEQMLTMSVKDIDTATTPNSWAAHWRKLSDAGSIQLQSEHRTANGKTIPVEIVANFIEFEAEQYNLVFVTDISQRLAHENERQQQRQALEEMVDKRTRQLEISHQYTQELAQTLARERSLLRGVIDSTPDLIFFKDNQGQYLGCNLAFEAYVNHPENHIIGRTDFDLFNQQAAESFIRHDQITRESGQIHRNEEWITYHDGRHVLLETLKTPLMDDQGRTIGLIGVSRDITTRHHLTEQLAQAKERADAANRAKSQFLANMSHEIRTPLNAILGFSQLLQKATNLDETQQQQLDTINRSGDHLRQLIDDILEISKIEAGRISLQLHTFDLHSFFAELRAMFQMRMEKQPISLILDINPSVPRFAKSDQRKLRQIMVNLLSNAFKFTEQGTINVTVNIRKTTDTDQYQYLTVIVEDTGLGIPVEDQARIFDEFEQASTNLATHGGTGLGLAICRKYVALMGGQLILSSLPGHGTTFRFEIRLNQADTTELPVNEQPPPIIGIAPGQKDRRILIVDDAPANRRLLVHLLKPLNLSVRQANDGEQAIECFKQWQPDLILMDLRMPGINGWQTTKTIRQLPGGMETRIVVVTASTTQNFDQIHADPMSPNGYITKPFKEQKLLIEVTRQLGLIPLYPETESQQNESQDTPKKLEDICPNQLMETDTCRQLLNALNHGDQDMALTIIQQWKTTNPPVFRTLDHLLQNYQFQPVIDWLNAHEQHDNTD